MTGQWHREPRDARPAIALAGPPASGKSTTGRELARRLHAALLDLDSITNPLFELVAQQRGAVDFSDPALADARQVRYEGMVRAGLDCLGARVPVVFVAPFTVECRDPERWRELAQRLTEAGGAPSLVWLHVPPTLLARRLTARAAARDAAKLLDVEAFAKSVTARPISHSLIVDATMPPQRQVDLLLRRLLPGRGSGRESARR